MGRIVIPTAADWATVDFANGLLMVEGRLAELLYPEAWYGCIGAWSHSLDHRPFNHSHSPYGLDGTRAAGAANPADGVGWIFDGTNDYIDLGGDVFDLGADDEATLSGWVRSSTTASNPDYTILGKRANLSVNEAGYSLKLSSNSTWGGGRIFCGNGSSGVEIQTTVEIRNGNWRHICGILKQGTGNMTILVDGGKHIATGTMPGGSKNNTNSLYIGRTSGLTQYFNGEIEDIRLYNIAIRRQMATVLAREVNAPYMSKIKPRVFLPATGVATSAPFRSLNEGVMGFPARMQV